MADETTVGEVTTMETTTSTETESAAEAEVEAAEAEAEAEAETRAPAATDDISPSSRVSSASAVVQADYTRPTGTAEFGARVSNDGSDEDGAETEARPDKMSYLFSKLRQFSFYRPASLSNIQIRNPRDRASAFAHIPGGELDGDKNANIQTEAERNAALATAARAPSTRVPSAMEFMSAAKLIADCVSIISLLATLVIVLAMLNTPH